MAVRYTHSLYWSSSDMLLFLMARVCEPIAEQIRQYPPNNLPRLHKPLCPLMIDSEIVHTGVVLCRLSLAGVWFPARAVLLQTGMLHLIKDLDYPAACALEASVSLSANCALNVLPNDKSFQIVSATPAGRSVHTFKASTVPVLGSGLTVVGYGV